MNVSLALDAFDHVLHDMNIEGDAGRAYPSTFDHLKGILLTNTSCTAETPVSEVNNQILVGVGMFGIQCNLLW